MKISGFTFVRNGETLGYPVAEAIKSVLPICDEFVIALGKGDDGDGTEELIREINDPKIKIIDTVWPSPDKATGAKIYSDQTNIALEGCEGDWCLYIQCDEVVHEKYLGTIKAACEAELSNTDVEGFLFKYKHFWGDYDHYQVNHRNYPFEVRLVRNGIGATSVGDAQSFRITPDMRKPNVIEIDAEVFHYGYVRHPFAMMRRTKAITANYHGTEAAAEMFKNSSPDFEYGSLEKIHRYDETTPAIMRDTVSNMNWGDLLTYRGESKVMQPHETFKERFRDFVESRFFGRRQPWGYRCYKRLAIKEYPSVEVVLPKPTRPEISLIVSHSTENASVEMLFESLQRQTFTDFEVLIVNEMAESSSEKIAVKWKNLFQFPVREVAKADSDSCNGEYLVCINSSTLLHSRFLQDHWERREHEALLTGQSVEINSQSSDTISLSDVSSGAYETPSFWKKRATKESCQYRTRSPKRKVKELPSSVSMGNFSLFKNDFEKLQGFGEKSTNAFENSIRDSKLLLISISNVAVQYKLFNDTVNN